MDVDTLLTRQMELHTSVRNPPKNPEDLVQLIDVMRNYKKYFESLRKISGRFCVEPETVFQAFMYISVGGAVNFDRQHQDGSVPMHQAKVLARSNAIELASTLRKELPNTELMVYVGLSRDLRTTMRVKVEDGNDLKTAETSVCEAVEYLNYIDRCAHHNPEKLFKFYMSEDPASLTALLNESDPLSMTQTMSVSTMRWSGVSMLAAFDEAGADAREPTPLPEPLSSFLQQLKRQCELASEKSSVSGSATRRLKAAQVMLDWVTAVPAEYFAEHAQKITAAVSSTLSLLVAEKRSALCRVGCEVITVLVQRLSPEPVFLDDVDRGSCSTNPDAFSDALVQWTASLAKGTYVTVAAISTAVDAALRAVAIQSRGHICVVKKLLEVLSNGTQTELRRKCLGYLSLCVAAAHAHRPEGVRPLIHLLAPVAIEYVSIGDSPSRKMARALCSVLRVLAPDSLSTSKSLLTISDERVEHLVQQERPQVEPAVLGGPQDLEELLFEADAFISSSRSSLSNSTSRHSGMAAARLASDGVQRGRGRGAATGSQLSTPSPLHDNTGSGSGSNSAGLSSRARGPGQPPLSSLTPAGSGAAVARRAAGEVLWVPLCGRRQTGTQEAKTGVVLGELRSPTRGATVAAGAAGGPRRAPDRQHRSKSPHNVEVKRATAAPPCKGHAFVVDGGDGVYDTDTFLGREAAVKKNAKTEGHMVPLSSTSTFVPDLRVSPGHTAQDGGSSGSSAVVDSHARTSLTRNAAPLLPSLTSEARRGNAPETKNNHLLSHDNNNVLEPLPHTTGYGNCAASSGGARPVPLSLRDGSGGRDDGDGAAPLGTAEVLGSSSSKLSGTEVVGPVRISRSLRRKIEEGKSGKDDGAVDKVQ